MAAPTWVDFYNRLTENARAASVKRATDGTEGIGWSRSSDQYKKSSGKSAKSFMDRAWNDNLSVGKRILDVLSRGNYASAGVADTGVFDILKAATTFNPTSLANAGIKAQQGELSPANILKQGWEGLSGQDKTTYADVLKNRGAGNLGAGIEGFGYDVLLDPTTYIGAGAVKSAIRGVGKLTGKSAKITEAAVQPVKKRAVEELGTKGETTVPVRTADGLLRDINRNVTNPGDAFQNIVKTTEVPTETKRGIVPEGDRTFTAGPGGIEESLKYPDRITDERFMLPPASADVIAGRSAVENLNRMAKGIPQFEYGSAVDDLDEFGPFKQTTERVIDEPTGVPQLRPTGTAEKAAAEDFSDLPPVTDKNKIRAAVLRKNDEPVFSQYEKFVDPETGVEAFRPAKDAFETTVGALRRVIATKGKGSEQALDILTGHLDAVENYAKSLASKGANLTGYGTPEGFIKDMYPAEWAAGARKKKPALDLTDLPEGPMKVEPKYKDITKIEKMGVADKAIYLFKMQQQAGLSDSDISYLAQAHNPKSFATRMQKIKNRVKDQGTKDVADLVDAIRTGRIQSETEPGLSELMQLTGAKTLKGLAQKLEQTTTRLSKAEQKMIGDIADNAVTKETRPTLNATKEFGPTGLEYKPYEGRAVGALENAQRIIDERPKPAAKIIEEAKAGDKSALARPASTLSVPQTKIFDRALQWAIDQEVIKPRDKALWAYVTRKGTLRTHKTPNLGKGRNRGAWNKYSQYTFFKNMMQNAETIDPQIKEILNAAGVRGSDRSVARSSAMYDVMMPVLKSVDDVLKQGGVFPVAGKGIADNPFSLTDVLQALDPDIAKDFVFKLRKVGKGYESFIAPTQLMDAFSHMVDVVRQGGKLDKNTLDNVKDILFEQQKTRNGKIVPNGLRNLLKGMEPDLQSEYLDDIVANLADAMPELSQRVERNIAERKLFHENQVAKGSAQSLEALADIIRDPAVSPGDIAGLSSKADVEVVSKVSRLKGIDENDAWMVKQEVQAKMPELGMGPEVQAQGHFINQMAGAVGKSARSKVGQGTTKLAEEESAKIAEEIGTPLSDLGTRFEQTNTFKMFKMFAPHLGNKEIRPLFLDRKSVAQTLGRQYQALLSDINKAHSKESILAGWKEIQAGTRTTVPEIDAAQDALQQAVNTLFSKNPDYNVFYRNNISMEDMNSHMAHFGIHEKYRFTDPDLMNDAYKTWDTDNPLDLLARMQASATAAASKRLLGDDISYRWGSNVKKEGYVKVTSHGHSELLKYVDTDMYYPRDIAKQFKVLDDFLKESMKPSTYNPMVNFLDNVLHSYKAGLTIYRPGHHVRNMVGDVWLAHMAGVNNPKYYTKAAKIMAGNHGRYRDFDSLQALMARQPTAVKGGRYADDGSPIVHVRVGGKTQAMSQSEVYRAASDAGILPDYRTLEDIQMGTESITTKIRPFGGKVNKAASSFSEARDHYVRLAHFMSDLEKGRYSSLQEAITKSAHNVRKWHPDGSDLTHFESKVMRRTFLFYSWIRKAMPLVVESMVMHPGKAMIYPKAMYNLAEANGIDLDSMSNPFPQDTLFPDWITDSPVGPVLQNGAGHYIGLNPGVPMIDVLNDYAGSQAGRTIAGSTNPFLKIPSELIAGQGQPAVAVDWRTGVKSYDTSDYIDRQIPFGTYLVGLTGKSPSSGFLQNKGNNDTAPANPYAFGNLMSGLGIFDMSKPGYQRQAQQDAKKRYQKQVGNQ